MLLSHHPKDKVILILGIQSTIVRTVLVQMKEGAIPFIFYSRNTEIPYHPHAGTSHLVKATLKTIRDSFDLALQFLHNETQANPSLPGKVSEVHYVLSSPWIVSRARTVGVSYEKSTTITRKIITDIIEAERKKDATDQSSEVETIEEKVFDVSLNGYSVAEWEGKSADKLDVSFATSIAGKTMLGRFHDAIKHVAHHSIVRFHSSLLLQYIGIQLILPREESYMLIHIHGELTDVVVVEHHVCVFFASFPRGVNTIRRSIAKALDGTLETADSLLTMSVGKDSDSLHGKKGDMAVDNMSHGWSGELSKLFSRSSYDHPLPKVAIVSARSHEDFFNKSFKAAHPDIRLETISIDEVKKLVSYSQKVESLRLTGEYAIAIRELEV